MAKLFEEKSALSQGEFGARYGIGTQGMVWQYLNGRRPLNIAAATAFATGLGVKIPSFSYRLAQEIERAYSQVTETPSHQLSEYAAKVIEAVWRADRAGEPETTFKLMLRLLPDPEEPFDMDGDPH
ncbi:helix-turn-helix transcriptional regulator [Burkholderia cepacia]|uniref:helix-turn-helix transcriptional regulator n=1 Tax=Burkholderia cepacia TaxID=292 RepID=UPI000F5A8AE1|nr:helix-turn-helix transcriptional regulator [Burkholderia cepacia]RQT74783.1 XRE family transcriptional regulator [Burkholderia cepacia]